MARLHRVYSYLLPVFILLPVVFHAGIPLAAPAFDPDSVIFARIDNVDRDGLRILTDMGVDIDSVFGGSANVYLKEGLLSAVQAAGYEVAVLPLPADGRLRTTSGYRTYDSLTAELALFAQDHANIARHFSIGKSVNGNDLWVMKITDNPDVDEDEPEVSLIAAMHGDEPVGMELCMNLIQYLGEKYDEKDPEVTQIINETEVWILPLMNPDGYLLASRYNASGYNLNREFPDRVVDPNNTPAERPPEVAHVMNWVSGEQSVLSANFHTGALVVNYPYDSDPDENKTYSATDDDALFRELSLTYSHLNPPMYASSWFENGIVNGVQWYTVYGGMQDWHYVWQGCHHVTIEVSDDKWPDFDKLPGLWEDNRQAMLAYIEWGQKGARGIVTDIVTGLPLSAIVTVAGNDHPVYTDPDVGDYHRLLLPGTYDLTCSAEGYLSKARSAVDILDGDAVRVDFFLVPLDLDVNADGEFNLADAILVLKLINNISSPLQLRFPDTNGNEKTGLEEVIFMLRACSK
jgi:hypothetical protein